MPIIKFILTLASFFVSFIIFSQTEKDYNSLLVPLELRSSGNAVVRYEKKLVEIIDYDKISVKQKRVVTILNKYGNRHANTSQYYDDNTLIEEMEAKVFDASGEQINRIKERDFIDESAVSDISIYEDNRVKYLKYIPKNYPYTIEYTSEVIYNSTAFFPNWQPIDDYFLSIQHSEYQIVNSAKVPLKVKQDNFENFDVQVISNNHFLAKNIQGIRYEVYAPELRTLTPHLKVALKKFNMEGVDGVNNYWDDFGKWMYDRLLTGTDEIPLKTVNEVKNITAGVDDKIERAKLVYKYMQDKTRYISVQVGIGGWKPMLANDVDKLGYADCKGLTNYTKALLEAVDVPSYYTVVYGGENIRDIDSDFSSIEGNHVILCVPDENENIFLECTSQTNPFGFTAGFTDDRDVLLVKPSGGEISHTKVYSADQSVQKTTAKVNLDTDGGFNANVKIVTTGLQYNIHQGVENMSDKDQKVHYKEYWGNINNLNVESVDIINDKDKIEYKEELKLSAIGYSSKSGNRVILEPNVFNKVSKIPPRYSERKLDFKIDRSYKDIDEFIIQLPTGLTLEAMTKSDEIKTKFGVYNFKLEELEGNKIKYSRTLMLYKGKYQKEEYDAFRDFRKQIVKYDKSKIVLVKS